jgi:uncharacterized membrane protein (DUF4010 family)
MQTEIVHRLAIALALGLVIGIERGWQTRDSENGLRRIGGVRTFGVVGLLGGVAALLGESLGPAILVVAFVGLAAVATASYVLTAPRTGDYGTTTELAMLLTFGLGAMSVRGYPVEASAAAVVTAVLLSVKSQFHDMLRRLERREFYATMQLLLIAVVVLPLLPDRGFGPWQALNPRTIGLLVLLIAGVSFVGYFAVKIVGPRAGLFVTALLGGLTSSTAVTLAFSRMARVNVRLVAWLGAGIGIAAATMAPRLLIEVAVVRPALVREIAPALLAMAVVPLLAGLLIARRPAPRSEAGEVTLRNPLELDTALAYGALLALLFLLARAAHAWLGEGGVYLLAALSGFVDVDAVSLSLARMAHDELPPSLAAGGIVVAALANTAAKIVLTWLVGGWAISRWAGPILLATLLAGAATAALTLG